MDRIKFKENSGFLENFHLYIRVDALLMDAALKLSCYKEESYCPIGLKKKRGSQHLDSVGAVCDRTISVNLKKITVVVPI